MNNNEKFRRMFVEFEKLVIHENGKDDKLYKKIKELKDKHRNPYYSEFDFIEFCRDCRNRISHDDNENNYLIYTDEFLDKFKQIIEQIKHPFKVYDKATKNIYSRNITDNVKTTMKEMKEMNYTHIPIYCNKKLVGIFSETSLFNYIYEKEIIEIDNNTIFEDILDYIKIDNSKEEVLFVDRDSLYDDVVTLFINDFKKGNKLSCVMITQNGKTNEFVLGIITSWDVIGR